MRTLQEIEDVTEINRLAKVLSGHIANKAALNQTMTVGYPSGRTDFPINFAKTSGEKVLWWSSMPTQGGETMINLVGRGNPNSAAYLMIDLQFNVPLLKFHRRVGGVFVRDAESGAVLLAHRGIVTRGKSRVPREGLLQETSATTHWVANNSGGAHLFLAAALESPTLMEDIATFAQEIRRAADAVMNGNEAPPNRDSTPSPSFDGRIREYFDEFTGNRILAPREATTVLVRHGGVVKALSRAMKNIGTAYKSKLVDLVIETPKQVIVFEIKTSLDTTSIYTAIGQLCVHSLALEKYFRRKQMRRVMVFPGLPPAQLRESLLSRLGIEVLAFDWGPGATAIFKQEHLAKFIA